MSITWNVPLVSQPDLKTCWLAVLKMMWLWRRGVGQDELWRRTYEPLAKTRFGKKQPMLVNFQIDQVARLLGMRSTQGPSVNLFEKSLSKGPVMFYLDLGGEIMRKLGSYHQMSIIHGECRVCRKIYCNRSRVQKFRVYRKSEQLIHEF
jgi:hypothetical protein